MDELAIRDCLATTEAKDFAMHLVALLKTLDPSDLPLAAGCTQGGQIDAEGIQFSVMGHERQAGGATARVGVFFTEVVGGCNCHDDPVRSNAYLVIEIALEGHKGQMDIRVSDDS